MTTPTTDAIMALADRYAFHIPGSQHSDEARDALLAALQAPNWSDIGRLIEAANGAAARGFISGTSNWAAFVSKAMGGKAREGEAVAPSAILARGRFHFFKGEDGEPDDWEWFEEGTNCEHGCIDAVIVRADAIAAPQPAQP